MVVSFFPLITLNILCHCFLVCRVSTEKSVIDFWEPLSLKLVVFSLAGFNILSLSSIFAILITMCLFRPVGVDPVLDSLYFLDLSESFLSQVREVFVYHIFICFLRPFLFLFFYEYMNIGAFNISQKSLGWSSFFKYTLFCSVAVISYTLSSNSLAFLLFILPVVFFISGIVLFIAFCSLNVLAPC